MALTKTDDKSSWITAVGFAAGQVAIFKGTEEVLLYRVPSWMPGLLTAGLGGRSIGRAYQKLIRNASEPYPYERHTGPVAAELYRTFEAVG